MNKSFQTKDSEFTAADHSGFLSLIPPNILMIKIYKTLECPLSVDGEKSGVQISVLLISRDLCG